MSNRKRKSTGRRGGSGDGFWSGLIEVLFWPIAFLGELFD